MATSGDSNVGACAGPLDWRHEPSTHRLRTLVEGLEGGALVGALVRVPAAHHVTVMLVSHIFAARPFLLWGLLQAAEVAQEVVVSWSGSVARRRGCGGGRC